MTRLKKNDLPTFPRCTSLRHLNCEVDLDHQIRLLPFKSLIEASPFLHKLKLKIINRNKIKNGLPKVRKVEGHPNEYLKEVEIVGFLGQPMEAEFVTYLLKSAINLEKIVIHIRYTGFWHLENLQSVDAKARRQMAKKVAHKLMKYRPGAELVLR